MSAAVKAGRAQYAGDPGILGGIVGGVTGFLTGGPAGAVAGAAAGFGIGGKKADVAVARRVPQGITWQRKPSKGWGRPGRFMGPPSTIPTTGGVRALPGQGAKGPNFGVRGGIQINPPFGGPPGMGLRIGGGVGEATGYIETSPGEIAEVVQTVRRRRRYSLEEGPPGPGYRLNKSDYWLRNGTFVPKGTVWVKSRRRNSLNPRALDRALSRVGSAKNAWSKLGRVTIRKACKHK